MRKNIIILIIVFMMLLVVSFSIYSTVYSTQEDFEVDSVSMKVSIKSDGFYENKLVLTNLAHFEDSYQISVEHLDGLVKVSSPSFVLSPENSKTLNILFQDNENFSEGVYAGNILISNGYQNKEVPVILEIESKDVLFDGNLAVYSSADISPGSILKAELKIFDLSFIGTSSLDITYFVKDFEEHIIFSETENVVVKDQVLINKQIKLPENLKNGDYVFGAVLSYKNSRGVVSSLIRVNDPKTFDLMETTNLIIFSLASILLIVIIGFVYYSFYSKDKLLSELKKQYARELQFQREALTRKECEINKNLKSNEEKEISRKVFEKLKIQQEKKLGEIQKAREKVANKLKKSNKQDELKKQIEKWKSEGYNTVVLERRLKSPTVKDIQKQIGSWKKKGYNVDVFKGKLKK